MTGYYTTSSTIGSCYYCNYCIFYYDYDYSYYCYYRVKPSYFGRKKKFRL